MQLRAPSDADIRALRDLLEDDNDHDDNDNDYDDNSMVDNDDEYDHPVMASKTTRRRRRRQRRVVVTADDDPDLLLLHNTDWTGQWHGSSRVLIRPQSVKHVSRVLKYCHHHHIGIVPQGGKTGLVGGSIPVQSEIILSLECLNHIHGLDPTTGIVTCQAGVILQTLQQHCHAAGYILPLDLGAKGTCQIGGNLATNAGGSFLARYGSLAANVLGMQIVLADGRVVHFNYRSSTSEHDADEEFNIDYNRNMGNGENSNSIIAHAKDNTGYKFQHLFLGSEGTLGVITGVAIQCRSAPRSIQTAWMVVDAPPPTSTPSSSSPSSNERTESEITNRHHGSSLTSSWSSSSSGLSTSFLHSVLPLQQAARRELNEILAALEWMDHTCIRMVAQHNSNMLTTTTAMSSFLTQSSHHQPSDRGGSSGNGSGSVHDYPHHLLLETHGSDIDHDRERVENFLELAMREGWIVNAIIAQDESQRQELWRIRESANPAAAATGYVYKYDISLPLAFYPAFLADMECHAHAYVQLPQQNCCNRNDDSTMMTTINANWGHLLDGNLHFNVITPGQHDVDATFRSYTDSAVMEAVMRRKGSISAEHGLGQAKNRCMSCIHDNTTLQMMQSLKQLFDPHGILNPNKYF